jgi:hypothetical protein
MDRNQHISEFNDMIFQRKIWEKYENILFVYTPPKVGSTSLVSSLRFSASHKYLILHVHNETMLNVLLMSKKKKRNNGKQRKGKRKR